MGDVNLPNTDQYHYSHKNHQKNYLLINSINILSDNQYSFKTKRSTLMAVMELVEGISTEIDNKEYTFVFFIDLKKAFDTIDLY